MFESEVVLRTLSELLSEGVIRPGDVLDLEPVSGASDKNRGRVTVVCVQPTVEIVDSHGQAEIKPQFWRVIRRFSPEESDL